MNEIATLTMNPAIDVSYEVDRVAHTAKVRAHSGRTDPGGGGINVARVLVRLGANARCYYPSGGPTGVAFDGLLDLHQLCRERIAIAGDTRVNTTIGERETGLEYRFVAAGPVIADDEWRECLHRLEQVRGDYLVISGSLPEGVPRDFYARAAAAVRGHGVRVVLDSSGPGLAGGLEGEGVFLVKPNLAELQQLAGRDLVDEGDIAEAAHALVRRGAAENVAVTMGADGSMLVSSNGRLRLTSLPVETLSAVGAGDSFLAAMVYRLALGRDMEDAFGFGAAAGAAAVMTKGTDLARAGDILRLHGDMRGAG